MNLSQKKQAEKLINHVESQLALNLQKCRSDNEKRKIIQRQIEATDREIDQLVYELYGLTKEEIRIVEGETK